MIGMTQRATNGLIHCIGFGAIAGRGLDIGSGFPAFKARIMPTRRFPLKLLAHGCDLYQVIAVTGRGGARD
jgi:hypothetical protein